MPAARCYRAGCEAPLPLPEWCATHFPLPPPEGGERGRATGRNPTSARPTPPAPRSAFCTGAAAAITKCAAEDEYDGKTGIKTCSDDGAAATACWDTWGLSSAGTCVRCNVTGTYGEARRAQAAARCRGALVARMHSMHTALPCASTYHRALDCSSGVTCDHTSPPPPPPHLTPPPTRRRPGHRLRRRRPLSCAGVPAKVPAPGVPRHLRHPRGPLRGVSLSGLLLLHLPQRHLHRLQLPRLRRCVGLVGWGR